MIQRLCKNTILDLAKGYPAIAITGPRQSGKTTLARQVFSQWPYVSFEDPDTLLRASNDPRGFLEGYQNGVVFDEVQKIPQLFSYLQGIIDAGPKVCRFVLTGSQQMGLHSSISQSLAGRVALIQLLPFAYGEIFPAKSTSISLDEMLFKGLYPPVYDRRLDPRIWYANYIQTYIERDVRQILNIHDLSMFQRFVRLCAARSGHLLNLSSMASDCGITHSTAASWISVLEASYIIFLLRPYWTNVSKRLIKTPKLYFYDPGLAAWLLSILDVRHLNIHPSRGALFETYVVGEFIKSYWNRGLPAQVFFFRDKEGHEIDLIIEHPDGLRPIEIKSGKTINSDYTQSFPVWKTIVKKQMISPTVVFGGDDDCIYNNVSIISWRDCVKTIPDR